MCDAAVHVEGVLKRFGAARAHAGVDLDVEEANVVGLLGPNAAGKTTLVRVVATLLAPDAGRADVFGRDGVHDAELLGLIVPFAAVDELLTGREHLQMFGRLFYLSAPNAHRRANELLGVAQALGCMALVGAFGLAISWIVAFVALTLRSAEEPQSARFVLLFPGWTPSAYHLRWW